MCKSGQGQSNDPDIKQTKQSPNALGWLQSALSFAWSIPARHRNLLISIQHGYFPLCAIAFATPSNWDALHPLFNQRKKAFIIHYILSTYYVQASPAATVATSVCRAAASCWGPPSPQGRGRPAFIPIPKKGNAKECSNYWTVSLISHTNKLKLKVLQARLQPWTSRCSSWF